MTDPEPQPLPEGDPTREAWVERIRAYALQDGASPPIPAQPVRQEPDTADPYRLRQPWVRRDRT